MADAEEKKPKAEHIEVSVQTQDGQTVKFKIKRTTRLGKMMQAWCDKKGMLKKSVTFQFDGRGLADDSTPQTAGIEDGDVIDVFHAQTGGTWLA